MDPLCGTSLFTELLAEDDAIDLAGVGKALADPARLRLLSIIGASSAVCACDLPALVGRSQPTVSHHLSQLVHAGILNREQRGQWAWFSLNRTRIDEIRAILV